MPPRSAVLCGSAGNLVWWSLMPSVAELFAGEVDEDCFQVWFGHSGVRDRETAVVSRRDDLQQDPAPTSHAEVDPAIDDCSRVNSCNAFLEEAGQAVEVSIRADHHDGVGSHRSLQIVWRIQDEDPAVVHDPDAVAQLIRFVHVVGGQEDGFTVVMELPEYLPQGDATLRVEARRRLVKEENGRTMQDGARNHEALGQSAGQGH